ncbi:MAG: PKD domain-containing protein, partial [Acidimicrobiales bacterium]|nr:PKD domain-containing protein [Acidimicrobiales bacterium]
NPTGSAPAENYTYYTTTPALTQYITDNQNGLLTLGGSVTYSLVTGDASTAGSEALPVTVTFTYAAGVTPASASGAGWTCSSLSPTVICTTTNVSTANPLNPGASLAPITVVATVSAFASTTPAALTSTAVPTSSDTTTTPTAWDPGTGFAPPAPSGLSLSPTSGPASGGMLTVISGSNLSSTTSVTFGAYTLTPCGVGITSQCFSVNPDGSLNVYTPPGNSGNVVAVSATNATGTSSAGNYTYYANPVLAIGVTDSQGGSLPLGGYVTYTVTSGSLNSGGIETQPVTVTYILPAGVTPQSAAGTGWSCAITGQVATCTSTKISSSTPLAAGSSLQAISVESAVSLSASTSPGALSSSGSIASSDATSAFIVDSGTGVSVPAPSGLSLSPNSGPAAGGGTTIISGTGLKGATSVTFGTYTLNICATGATSQCFVINPNGTLTVYAPPGTAGNVVAVSVTTPGGTSSAGNYTYTANPILSLSATDNQNGSLPLGGFITYTLSAGATSAGGADPNQLNLTYTLSTGVTPTAASGTGWSCTIVGQDVICSSTGVTGINPLLPATTLSAISIAASISSGASVVANALTSNGTVTSTSATSASATDPGTGTASSVPGSLYLSPTTGPSIGGAETIIHGTGLSGATSILFGINTLLPCALGSTTSCFVINGDGTITVYTPPGTVGNNVAVTVTTPSGSGNAGNFLYTGNSIAYVTNAAYHLVYPINLDTSTIMAPTQGMSQPNGIAVSPDSNTIYVTNATGNDVSAISTATGLITTTYAVGTDPKGIAITPDGKTLVVPNWLSASVTLINTQTSATTTVSVPGRPRNAVISSDGNTAYIVVDQASTTGYIVPLNLTTLALGTSVTVGDGPLSAVLSSDGKTAYVANEVASTISVVNLISSTVTATLSMPSQPEQIVLSTNNSSALVTCFGASEVVPLDLSATPPIEGTPISGFHEPNGIAIDNSTGKSYVANFNPYYTGSLSSFNIQTGALGTSWTTSVHAFQVAVAYPPSIPSPSSPTPVSAPPAPAMEAFVANAGAGNITPVNTALDTSGTPISIGSQPEQVVVTPGDNQVFVTNYLYNTVTPYILSTNTALTPIAVGADPVAMAASPDGSRVYVANYSDYSVTPIDTSTDTALPPITVGDSISPQALAISPDGTKLYVASSLSSNQGYITIISLPSGVITSHIYVGTALDALAIAPNGSMLYAADKKTSKVYAINLSTDAVTNISVGQIPSNLALTSDGSTLLVTSRTSNTISEIATSTNTVGATYAIGPQPSTLAIEPGNLTALVGLGGSNEVVPFTISNGAVGAPVEYGSNPSGIAVESDPSPVASFSESGTVHGSPTLFDASGSTSPVGTIVNYSWNFGDGNTANTSTASTSHTYASAGSYTVTLTVTDSAGTSTSVTYTGQDVINNGSSLASTQTVVSIS